jgi:2,4-dienoyl-CoA reductase-like NADH-dependent reductase (Old Yellow Enzyme family)
MNLANRFVRSATWEGLAEKDGAVTPRLIEMMAQLAENDVGLIISGYTFVSPEGQSGPGQMGAHSDRFLPGLRKMAEAVHVSGGKIALQIVHAGFRSNHELTGLEVVGPSAVERNGKQICRSMSEADIANVISAFSDAAMRAKQAGFDAVQIHGAHGFLLTQFLSPALNKRTDKYGGTLQNRARILLEVLKAIREVVGSDYPILIKLNSEDFSDDGMTLEEAIEVSRMLEEASINAIEFSGGTVDSPKHLRPPRPGALKDTESEAYYRNAAVFYKQKIAVPLMLVGGIRSYEVAEELVVSGRSDYIALSRPLICEPGLIQRWRKGDRRKSECGSCNKCFAPGLDGRGIYCVALEKKRNLARQ